MLKSSHPRPVFYTFKRKRISNPFEKGQKAAMGDCTVKRYVEPDGNQYGRLSHVFLSCLN
jgi:hypothetical protein